MGITVCEVVRVGDVQTNPVFLSGWVMVTSE